MIIKILKEIIEDTKFRLSKSREIEIQGFKMWINTKEPSYVMRRTLRYYSIAKVHEPSTTELFKSIIKEGDIVADIGANIGYFSLLAKKLGAKKVYAFEPERKNYLYLVKNTEINKYNFDINARSCAISNEFSMTRLYLCSYDSGHHTLNQNEGIKDYRRTSLLRKFLDIFRKEEYQRIITEKLDNLIEEKVNIIKMDCEGSEALALEGMDRILKENKDIKIIMEFFPLLLEKMGSSPKVLIEKILDYGFKIYIIPHDYCGGDEFLKVGNYNELMGNCQGREDHLNLYLCR